ncbi:MAG: methyl-accepting chemotaxis protein [Spirochaetota bacterium]
MKLTIGKKLASGFGTVLLLMTGITTGTFISIRMIVDADKKATDAKQLSSEMLQRERDHLNWTLQLNRDLMDRKQKTITVQIDPSQCAFGKWYYSEKRTKTEAMSSRLAPLFREIESPHTKLHETAQRIAELRKSGEEQEARAVYLAQTQAHLQDVRRILNDTRTAADEYAAAMETEKQAKTSLIQVAGNSGSILAILIGIAFAVLLTRSIAAPLRKGAAFAHEIAQGNLTVMVDEAMLRRADEIGLLSIAFRDMIEKLRTVVESVSAASANMATGSEQLSSSSVVLSQGAGGQAASVEEVSSSMEEVASTIEEMSSSVEEVSSSIEETTSSIEEMSSTIAQNADNASQTESIAKKAAADAKAGGDAVNSTVRSMKEISDKVKIIQEIARQTNLLSLNASIEAARAGEHGKGFAVVASEVQKLADRSQRAAAEIEQLSKSSVEVSQHAGELLVKLVPDIQRTAELVAEISAASAEQSNGAKQINMSVQQVNTVVQQISASAQQISGAVQQVSSAVQNVSQSAQNTASSSEEVASTAEELSAQAGQLMEAIGYFRVENSHAQERHSAQYGKQILTGRKEQAVLEHHAPPPAGNSDAVKKMPAQVRVREAGAMQKKSGGFQIDMKSADAAEDAEYKKF